MWGYPAVTTINVLCSVSIVLLNKVVFSQGLPVPLLACLHYGTTVLILYLNNAGKGKESMFKQWQNAFVVMGTLSFVSVLSANWSLQLNSVTFYQIFKLLALPCTVVTEYMTIGYDFTALSLFSLLLVSGGVAFSTLSVSMGPLTATLPGIVAAFVNLASVTACMVMARYLQTQRGASTETLSFLSCLVCFVESVALTVGFVDSSAVLTMSSQNQLFTAVTCVLAAGILISSTAMAGKGSVVSYHVVSNLKTVLVVAAGVALFGEDVSPRRLFGLSVAISGMVLYAYSQIQIQQAKQAKLVLAQQRAPAGEQHVVEMRQLLRDGGDPAAAPAMDDTSSTSKRQSPKSNS